MVRPPRLKWFLSGQWMPFFSSRFAVVCVESERWKNVDPWLVGSNLNGDWLLPYWRLDDMGSSGSSFLKRQSRNIHQAFMKQWNISWINGMTWWRIPSERQPFQSLHEGFLRCESSINWPAKFMFWNSSLLILKERMNWKIIITIFFFGGEVKTLIYLLALLQRFLFFVGPAVTFVDWTCWTKILQLRQLCPSWQLCWLLVADSNSWKLGEAPFKGRNKLACWDGEYLGLSPFPGC